MGLRTTVIATVTALTLAFGAVGVGVAAPAAAAPAPPVVVSPGSGGTVYSGSTGPLIIDFPTAGEYLISVDCDEYYWYNGAWTYYSGRQSIDIEPLVGYVKPLLGACEVEVTGRSALGVPAVTSTFTLVPSPDSLNPPVVVSPATGGTLATGTDGPLVIDFPVPGEYTVTVKCGSAYSWSSGVQPYSGRQTIPIRRLGYVEELAGSTCQIDVAGGSPNWHKTSSTFTVVIPPLSVSDVTTSNPTFYPLIKDGYLDTTDFRQDFNRVEE